MCQQTAPLPFDVRSTIEDADLDDEAIQCTYDAINRMVVLIGDIPFDELFSARIRVLATSVLPRVEEASRLGLVSESGTVEGLIQDLIGLAGDASLKEFYVRSRDRVKPETHLVLRRLRRHGIRIPLPVSDQTKQGERAEAIEELMEAAPEWTFLDLFTKSSHGSPQRVQKALRQARALGLLSWWNNDRCCKKGEVEDECVPYPNKYCAISQSPIAGGLCTAASDPCPAKPGSSEKD